MTDKLTEAVAIAVETALVHLVERDTLACDLTQDELRKVAMSAITAMREQMVPVAWMYESEFGKELLLDKNHETAKRLYQRGWTETPLYAWPEEG